MNIVAPNKKRLKKVKGDIVKTKDEKMAKFLSQHWFVEIKPEDPDTEDDPEDGKKGGEKE